MRAKHTPGPWIAGEFEDEAAITSEDRMDMGAVDICTIELGFVDEFDDEQKANARLIAAAPVLLEALKDLADLYDTDEGCRSLPEYIAARAAIAKAIG